MKIVFMGTPDFAVGALESLIEAGHTITAVVTQPDKPKGRSGKLTFPPVKECACKYGIPVFQPVKIKEKEAVETLASYEADIFIVAAFGQILSQEILDMPRYGCLNIHASLLPRYRGASPIQSCLLAGEKKTGVTIMQMDAGLDTGDMIYKKELEIAVDETFETLHDRLMELGGTAIVEALALLEQGKLSREKQNSEESTYASLIKKEMGLLHFEQAAKQLDCVIRGMNPWPSAYAYYQGLQMKIWRAVVVDCEAMEPGLIYKIEKDGFYVAAGQGGLKILELQLEGKKRMSAHDFLLGGHMQEGQLLTSERP